MTPKLMPRHLVSTLMLLLTLIILSSVSFGQNPIFSENQQAGTPQSEWFVNEGGPIEGFAQEFSVNKGETVHFKINIASETLVPYTVKIYRIGYYQGNGARLIADLGNSLMGKSQPAYNYETATGKVDCSNWSVSATWQVPNNNSITSGVYIAKFECPTLDARSIQQFIVRDDAANAPLLFKTSDATWQAYNTYGGNTFYAAATPVPGFTHATKISYQRPVYIRGDKSSFFNSEYPMIRWLERNGYNVSYTSDMDMARDNSIMTPANHKVILSVGHDEYYSLEQRNKIENARANGVHLAFFSGNEIYWKTRWEDNYQTLVCYKEGTMGESVCGGKCDPMPNVWTGLWRDGCSPAYAANDGCKPEGSLSGQMSWSQSFGSIKVPDTYKNLRFWKNTSVASLGAGQTTTLPFGTLGSEWDPEQYTETYPAHRVVISNTSQTGLTHKMALYRYNSGALIFSAGTMNFAWGLDDQHELTGLQALPASADMQQFTANLFHDMGVEASNLQAGLVTPTTAPDALAPSTTITSPANGSALPGNSITITGTSVDNGSGAVAGVEVSIDNGLTWNLATGLENWSYTFSPSGYGTFTIKVRAWDDLGNVEIPGAAGTPNAISVSASGPFQYSVFNSSYPANAPFSFTGAPVELGMKFRSSVTGNITGFRYYKNAGITGTHTGHLWSSTGTLLGEAVFTNETASGWQTVTLASPVAIAANTTYVVSYFTASGDFVKSDPFFTQPVINGFLRGLANGEDGGNGVYGYSNAPTFPSDNFGSSNYFADVIFESNDLIAPTVISVTPANNATGAPLSVHPTATFSEALSAASVTRSAVVMNGPGGSVVSGSVSLTNGSTITFTPNADLAYNTTYTVTLKGGTTEPVLKDLIGNALAANYTWSFTTGALAAPIVTTKPISQTVCANSVVSFNSSASGIPTPSVQWEVSTNGGSGWSTIVGATASVYSFTILSTDNNNQYRARWSNSQGLDISAAAILTVSTPVTGSIVPVNSTICPGSPMQLQLASAAGPSPYTLVINSNTYPGITVGQSFSPILSSETIWNMNQGPLELIHTDNNSIEVGVKFQANKAGVVKGIRFYKGSNANGGTHTGSLWSQSGSLLATATFTNETASGWQEVLFANPVSVSANTTYVASYFLPQGNYSKNPTYFSAPYSNGNSLTALQGTGAEPNAVYTYTSQSSFPDQNAGDPNYWVDVVFAAYVPAATTTFNLTSITAANGCSANANPISTATITLGSVINAGTVSGTTSLCIGSTAAYSSNGSANGLWSSSDNNVATVDPLTGIVTATGAGSSAITYTVTGCNGVFSASQSLTVDPNASAGSVSGNATLCIGATSTYTSNGNTGGTWSSNNNTVASVNAAGLVTALAAGTTSINYTVSAGCNSPVSSSNTLTVNPNATAGIVSGTASLCIGATTTYTSNGDATGAWSSSNPTVASVNSNGLVTALASGTTNITYTVNAGCNAPVSSYQSLTVNPNAIAGAVSGTASLCIGTTATYTSNGNAGGTWISSNPAVASVNANGLVSALSAGTTNITYTLSAGCNAPVSAYQSLTVNPNASAGTVFAGLSTLCIGTSINFTSNGNAGGTWSSSNPAVASVNAAGSVTALAAGTTNITYTVSSGCNSPVSSFVTITVSSNANAGIVSGTAVLCIGATSTYASNGNAGGGWSSSNPAVASVNAAGLVTALAAGSTNITYSVSTNCGGPVSAFKTLIVNPNATAGIVSGNSSLCIASTATYTSNGNTGGTWSSSNTTVASVNASGVVTALSAGTTNITYTITTGCNAPGSSFQPLTVNANVIAGTVNGTSPLCINATSAYTSNGTTGGTWSSSNTAVATVNAAGLVQALAAGTTNVTYTVTTGCNAPVSTFKTLTVSPNMNAGTVSGTSPLCIAATATYTSNGTTGGTWSSSNIAVATVNANGLVTALSAGTANITYTLSTGCGGPVTAFKTITVNPTANAGVISGNSPLCIAATATYSSNGNAGGTWSSSNPTVATVNAAGLVTALTAGTTNITYTVNTGCGSPISSFKTLTVGSTANAGTVSGNSPLCIAATAAYSSNGTTGGTWSSSNAIVATVSASGVVTALTAGTTNITYTVSTGCTGTISSFKALTVNPSVSAGTISGNSPLCKSSTATYSTNGTPGGTWSSSNPVVASVNAAGLVTALSAGTTNIIYTISSGCNSPVTTFKTLTVTANTNAGTVSGNSPLCIAVTATYSSNGNTGGVWSSSNTAVATVNVATGVVTAVSPGTANIIYSVTGCTGLVTSSKTLTVNPNSNAGTVSGVTPYCSLQISQFSSNGDAGGTWSSSNPLVAFVTPQGYVVGLFFGTADITYTVTTGCNAPVSATKTVAISLFAYAGNISGNSPVCAGTTNTYTSSGTTAGTWSSNNTGVAAVNATTGVVTAVSAGSAVISYTVRSCFGDATASKTITVNPLVTANAGTVSGSVSMCRSTTASFTSNGNAGGTWSSSNTTVATVNATTGLVTALSAGTTNIIYSVTPNCGNVAKAIKTLTVTACNSFAGNTSQSRTNNNADDEGAKAITKANPNKGLSIEAYPNPSTTAFTLVLKGYSNDKVSVIVTDMLGNKVYQVEGAMQQRYSFGNSFRAGIYLVQVMQGDNKQSMKLLKGQ